MITVQHVQPDEMIAYVELRGFTVWPLVNGDRILGYKLKGPRGNRTIIMMERDGLVSMDAVKLWCDGVEYATNAIAIRRLRKEGRV